MVYVLNVLSMKSMRDRHRVVERSAEIIKSTMETNVFVKMVITS